MVHPDQEEAGIVASITVGRATFVFGAAIGSLLLDRGWHLDKLPGQPVVYVRDGATLEPFAIMRAWPRGQCLRRRGNSNAACWASPAINWADWNPDERLLPAGHTRPDGRAIDGGATQIHRRDFSRVRDVLERIGIEHDEVGALAWRDGAEIVEPQQLRGVPR